VGLCLLALCFWCAAACLSLGRGLHLGLHLVLSLPQLVLHRNHKPLLLLRMLLVLRRVGAISGSAAGTYG